MKSWNIAAAVVIGTAAISMLLRPHLAPVNLAMFYLLGVVAVSARSRRNIAVATAFASVAAFDFFCVPPYYTFVVEDSEYLVTFVTMLVVALMITTLTDRIRKQAQDASEREVRANALYRMSERLTSETRIFETARVASELASEALSAQVVIFLPEGDHISFQRRTSEDLPIPNSEESIGQWVYRHGRKAGLGVDPLPPSTAVYVPLRGARSVVGVMAVVPTDKHALDVPERKIMIDLFANQAALAIERTLSQNAAEASRLQIQTEQMRSSLLSAVSHDLRTPLASIRGAASTLLEQGERLSQAIRNELLEGIAEETERLSRLVGNLLDMTRFESGAVQLRRELCPLEDIVGTALARLNTQLQGRTIHVPAHLPLVNVDEVLLGQVFVNLFENAVKYTPPESAIEINVTELEQAIQVDVRDNGPGFAPGDEEHVFEKFYRSRSAGARGAGLGLAIAKGVVEAHGGQIAAFNHAKGGAVLRFSLPIEAHALDAGDVGKPA